MENLHNIIESKIRTALELSDHKFLNVDNDEDMQYIKDYHTYLYNKVLYYDYMKYFVLLFIDDENYVTLMWRTMEHMLFNIGRQPGEHYDIHSSLIRYSKYKSIINFNDKMDALVHVHGDSLEEVALKMDLIGI